MELFKIFNSPVKLFVEFVFLLFYPIAFFYPWKKNVILIYKKNMKQPMKIKIRRADSIVSKAIGYMFSEHKEPLLFDAPCCLWTPNINKDIIAYALIKKSKKVHKEMPEKRKNIYEIKYKKILRAHDLNSTCFNDCDAVLESFYEL